MMNSMEKIYGVLVLLLLTLPAGAMAAAPISTIAPGNTVFVGEEGLDITAALDGYDRIGWWASAANLYTSAPSYTMTVSNPSGFSVYPSEFSGRLGPWYRINPSGVNCPPLGCDSPSSVVFTVADPNLDLRIEDATLGYDATNGWIPLGDEVQFRITTNLYQITQRPGVSVVPIRDSCPVTGRGNLLEPDQQRRDIDICHGRPGLLPPPIQQARSGIPAGVMPILPVPTRSGRNAMSTT